MGIDVIGKSSDTYTYISEYDIFVAIVNNKKREKIQGQLETVGAKIATLKCP
jgi:hypothetical protein